MKHVLNLLKRRQGTFALIFHRKRMSGMADSDASLEKVTKFKEVTEGKAKILFENTNNVFYNNVQEFNRDLTIVAITEYVKEHLAKKGIEAVEFPRESKNVVHIGGDSNEKTRVYPGEKFDDGITILEALSATGLRSIRVAKEVPGVREIIANDISKSAVDAIKRNIKHNEVEDIVTPNEADASILMYQYRKGRENQFDVVDIDPYGTASPFLDSAVQAVKPQGLLCVTCTDMAVLAGNTPETCWSKYRAMPVRIKACHEQALRILLGAIEQSANRYSRYIEPLLSISVDFYIRVFVKVHYGAAKVKLSAGKQSYVISCGGCGTLHFQPVSEVKTGRGGGEKHVPGIGPPVGSRCDFCGSRHSFGGPIWAAPLYNMEFLQKVFKSVTNFPERLKTSTRIKGFVKMMMEELQDVPLHYTIDELSSAIKCNSVKEIELRSAVMNAGYRVSSFHGRVGSFKTDAPPSFLWDIMKALRERQGLNNERLKEGTPTYSLVHRKSTTENIDFTIREDAEAESKRLKIVRFPEMPENWGPKARAKDNSDDDAPSEYLKERSKKFQGKRKARNEQGTDKRVKSEAARDLE